MPHRPDDSLWSRLHAEWEAATVLHYLTEAGGNVTKCADALGISRRSVQYMLDRYGLDAEAERLREAAREHAQPVSQVRSANPAEVADGAKPVAHRNGTSTR